MDANGHWHPVTESAAGTDQQQPKQQAGTQPAPNTWKHTPQQPVANGTHHAAESQQQESQPNMSHTVKSDGLNPAAGPWTGRLTAKAEKPALPSMPPTDDELSIRTATDPNAGSSSSSDDSTDGVVVIKELAAQAAVAAAAAAANGVKASPPSREAPAANGKLPSSHAQQNGRVKGSQVVTFGPQELLAYQFAEQMPAAAGTAEEVRSTLAQHDLLRDQPASAAQLPVLAALVAAHAATNGPVSSEAGTSPAEPLPQQQQASQASSLPASTDSANSYAARAAAQQRSVPSYSTAVVGTSTAPQAQAQARPAVPADYNSAQRRGQRPYNQAAGSTTSTGSTSTSSRPQQPSRSGSSQQATAGRPARQDGSYGNNGGTGRPSGSPSSSSGSDPWSSYQPGAPQEPSASYVPGGSTDLERLLQQVTPMLHLEGKAAGLEDLRLEDVWRFYQEPSLYGREVYTLGGTRGPSWSYFVPYLSAMQLFVPSSPKDPGTNRLYISDMEGWPKHMHLLFEYFERELPFNRMPLHDMIESLSSRQPSEGGAGALLMEQQVAQLHPASWFSVAWYPVYRIPDAPLTARFLTFHSFAQVVINLRAQKDQAPARPLMPLMPLQVIGLKWQNLQGERWLESLPEEGASSGASGGRGRGRMQHSSSVVDIAWQSHLSELQATAERLSRGTALRILGQMGAEAADLRHPDFEFFHTRG